MKKAIKVTKNIIFFFSVFFLLAYLVVSIFFPAKTISVFGFSFYRVVSPSMKPEINVNDIVCVVGIEEDELEIGDIINFQTHTNINGRVTEITVTHYLGFISEESSNKLYRTQSYIFKEEGKLDTWLDTEGYIIQGIPFENINGKVAFKIPYLGHLIKIIKNPIMLLLIAINTFVIIVLIKVIKNKEKPVNKTKVEE
jgi:signal peptidase